MILGGIFFGVLTLSGVSGTIIWVGILAIFELIVGFSENNTKKECPHCTSERTNRLISTFASLGSGNSTSSSSSSCSTNSRFT
jgi:hypothetical protein